MDDENYIEDITKVKKEVFKDLNEKEREAREKEFAKKIKEVIDEEKKAVEKTKEEIEKKRREEIEKKNRERIKQWENFWDERNYKLMPNSRFWAILIISTILAGFLCYTVGWAAYTGKFQTLFNQTLTNTQQQSQNVNATSYNNQVCEVYVNNTIIVNNPGNYSYYRNYNNTNST